jgi:DNA-binding transcriptional LysR family regulator
MGIDLDLRRLRFFVEVVRQGGFSPAAKVVFATQSAVSKAVKQLEDELGLPLLNRIGHRTELTEAGKVVYRRALGLLAQAGDLTVELAALRGLEHGRLLLGFARAGSSAPLAALFAEFRRRYPNIEVQMSVHGPGRLEELLNQGELDLAALLQPVPPGLAFQEMRNEPLVALLPRGHALAERKSLKLARLAHLPFILFEEGFALNEMILEVCAEKGIAPQVAARSGQVDFILELVAAGMGVAFLPQLFVQRRPHRSVCAVPLDEPKCNWRLVMAWRESGYLSHAAQAWLALAQELASPNR